jgi:hypothetical protein
MKLAFAIPLALIARTTFLAVMETCARLEKAEDSLWRFRASLFRFQLNQQGMAIARRGTHAKRNRQGIRGPIPPTSKIGRANTGGVREKARCESSGRSCLGTGSLTALSTMG